MGQAERCGGVKYVFFIALNSPPIHVPLANVEKLNEKNTHSKTQFKRIPSPMTLSEEVTKENKQNEYVFK